MPRAQTKKVAGVTLHTVPHSTRIRTTDSPHRPDSMRPPTGAYKTALIKPRGPWRNLGHVEFTTTEYVDWCNHRRLYYYCDDIGLR